MPGVEKRFSERTLAEEPPQRIQERFFDCVTFHNRPAATVLPAPASVVTPLVSSNAPLVGKTMPIPRT
jgi:hypothetical protein